MKTPYPKRKSISKSKKSLKRVVLESNNEENIEKANYQLNRIPRIKSTVKQVQKLPATRTSGKNQHQRLGACQHQSMTFIADLAQTSTPTRTARQPITSTPKQLTHDPLKYHPTQTIRSKKTAIGPTTTGLVKCSICCQQRALSKKRSGGEPAAKQQRCLVDKRKRKRANNSFESSIVCASMSCDLCNHNMSCAAVSSIGGVEDLFKTSTKSTQKSRVKFKTSNIEISIHDLLYAPAKTNKFELVTTTRPRMKKQQVYFL